MPVRFILGRAGVGKTHHCFEQIAQLLRSAPLGSPIFWLLPRQATFQAQRELACRLGGFSRVRVLSFDELGHAILADCGDVGIPEVTPIGRRLVIAHLLRTNEKQLKFYQSSARRAGLAAELDSTFGEFSRAGVDAPKLEESLAQLDAADPLADKLHDLSLLLSKYQAYIGQERLDPHRRLELVMRRVGDCRLLNDATVFVDDFFDFSAFEQKLLVAVAKRSRTEIGLLIDPASPIVADPNLLPDDLSLLHRTERTYRSLHWALRQADVPIDPPLILTQPQRFNSVPLAQLEKNLFAPSPSPIDPETSIEFFDAPDLPAEVDAVARRIRAALRGGLRLRDIAVLVRNLDEYHEPIRASFTEHELPHFSDRRRTAAHHPLLQFVRSALLIARDGFPHEAVMAFTKTGLADVSFDEADELENYVLRHRIRGAMWSSPKPWEFRRHLTSDAASGDDPSARIDAIRQRVLSKLSPFLTFASQRQTISQFVAELIKLLEAFGVRAQLLAWMNAAESAGNLEQRGEHEQVWANLTELLEHIANLLGAEPATVDDFLDCLDAGLETFDLALPPQTIDGILVGQIDRTRTPPLRLVFVLGLNQRSFPTPHRPDCVFSDSQRAVLAGRKIDLDPDTQRRMLDERFLAYLAFTRASQRLVLSRPLSDINGRTASPSIFWNNALQLLSASPGMPAIGSEAQARRGEGRGGGSGKVNATLNAQGERTKNIVQHELRASADDPRSIGTPRQLVTALMRWARGKALAVDPWPALYQWLAQHDCCDDAIDHVRFRAWKALSYSNAAVLSPAIAAQLFPAPLRASVTQIEAFAACPFQHFVGHGLCLQHREPADVTHLDLGLIYHRILENLVGEILAQKLDWRTLDADDLARRISRHAREIGGQIRGELMLSSARNHYLLTRIETTLLAAVQNQREIHRRGKFRPAFTNLRFGDGQKLPAFIVTTPAGRQIQLSGKIDRVDLHEQGDQFAVADYKLSGGVLALERVFHGLSLQLLTDLLVLQETGQKLTGRKLTAAAGFFLQLLHTPQSVDHPAAAVDPSDADFHLRNKPRGIIAHGALASVDSSTTQGHSPVAQFFINKDGNIGHRHNTDVADEADLSALLRQVLRRIGKLADRLMSGDIRVFPYRLRNHTPCPHCRYQSVCRFEPGINRYNFLPTLNRQDVLTQLTIGGGGSGGGGDGD